MRVKQRLALLINRALLAVRGILGLPFKHLRGEMLALRTASVESMAYVTLELQRIADNLDRVLEELGQSESAVAGIADSAQNGEATMIEAPFAFRSLAEIDSPAPILIVGTRGAAIGASLASLGYEVTILDPSGTMLEHPKVEVVREQLGDWNGGARRFDAVLFLADPEQADRQAMERMGALLSPDGLLVLTVRFGFSPAAHPEQGYDHSALSELLNGWRIAEQKIVTRRGEGDWAPLGNGATAERGVALVAAQPVSSAS